MKRILLIAALAATGPALAAPPDTITLPAPLVDKILSYLVERPFREVAPLLGQMNHVIAPQMAPKTPVDPKPDATP